jgi:glycosyltransferase involved in cell wall biosynthesis
VPIDICMLTNVHHPLDQRIFYKEALSLGAAGFRVAVIGPAAGEVAGRRDGVEVEVLRPAKSLVGRLKNMALLLSKAWNSDARCFHLHDPELLFVGLALRLLGRRVVYDVHEHFPQAVMVRPWVPNRMRRGLSWLVDRVETAIAGNLYGVVGVVDEQAKRFSRWPFAAVKNYLLLECFSPPKEYRHARFELIHLGSLPEARGGLFLLEVERGQYQLRGAGAAFAPGPLLRRARVGLIPGQVSEQNNLPFVPTKLFEYLACGLPVASSDLPSLRRFRDQGNWGYVVKADDAQAHAWAIAHLLKNPDEAAAMGRRGRQAVEQCWNWDIEAEKIVRFYREIFCEREVDHAL